MTESKAIITLSESSNPKLLALVTFGPPIAILALAIFFPFFFHLFNFASLALMVFLIIVAIAFNVAREKEDGVKVKENNIVGITTPVLPKWFRATFFITMIAVSAGLQMWFYLVPVFWIVSWICLESIRVNVKEICADAENKRTQE